MAGKTKEQTANAQVGIYIRGNSIRILFYYNSVRCYETVATGASKANINYAVRRRAEILRKIEDGEFDYRLEFPESNNVKKFYDSYKFTCGDYLIRQLSNYQRMTEVSELELITLKTYRRIINHKLLPFFANMLIGKMDGQDIKRFINSLDCSAKYATQVMIPLRAALDEAVNDGVLNINPLNQLALAKLIRENFRKSSFIRERFTECERDTIIDSCNEPMVKHMITVGFFTGLRIGELIALRWENIHNDYITVTHNQVKGETTTPKTDSGIREVIMLPRAKQALIEMHKLTGEYDHVFVSKYTKQPWQSSDALQKQWVKILAKAKVKYRIPYLMRHTFAWMLINNGESLQFVADQLGHRDMEMVIRIYGGTTKRINYKLKGSY